MDQNSRAATVAAAKPGRATAPLVLPVDMLRQGNSGRVRVGLWLACTPLAIHFLKRGTLAGKALMAFASLMVFLLVGIPSALLGVAGVLLGLLGSVVAVSWLWISYYRRWTRCPSAESWEARSILTVPRQRIAGVRNGGDHPDAVSIELDDGASHDVRLAFGREQLIMELNPGSSHAPDQFDKLAALKQLLDSGAITAEIFAEDRRRCLDVR